MTPHSVVLFLPDSCSYNSRRLSVELRISLIAVYFSFFPTQLQNVAPFSYFVIWPSYSNKHLARFGHADFKSADGKEEKSSVYSLHSR